MKQMGPLSSEESSLLKSIKARLQVTRDLLATDINSLKGAVSTLAAIREAIYEDLNQFQHEALLLEAVRWLEANVTASGPRLWEWNPRQTGGVDEPDLRCKNTGVVAEATASKTPAGVIDTRMRNTLEKLSEMMGRRYYFVKSEAMRRRAETKVQRAGWDIHVVLL